MDYASFKRQGRISYSQIKTDDPERVSYTSLKKQNVNENERTVSYAELNGTQKSSQTRPYSNTEHKLKITEEKLAVSRERLQNRARNGSKEFPKVRRLKSNDLQNRGVEEFVFKRFSTLKKSKKGTQNQRVLHERTEDLYPLAVELGYSNQVRIFTDHLPKHYEQPSNKADYFTVC